MKTINELKDQAKKALTILDRAGAKKSLVTYRTSRQYQLSTKNDSVELLKEAQDLQLTLNLYDDHRFGTFATSETSEQGIQNFVQKAVAMVRLTDPDPAHGLPDKQYTSPLPTQELEICDPALVQSKKGEGHNLCQRMTQGARAVSSEVIHVEASFREAHQRSVTLSSEGFQGERESTMVTLFCESYVKDGMRKQEEYDYRMWRHWSEVKAAESIGQTSAQRALAMKSSTPLKTGKYPVVMVNYRSDYVVDLLVSALSGKEVYRKTSCLQDKLNQPIAPKWLTLTDDPFLKRSLGARKYDEEGMVARAMPLIEKGTLRNFYFNSYWARKQGVKPTTSEESNIVFSLGKRSGEKMIQSLEEGIFITNFIGGNFNSTSGDFSVGIRGFLINQGKLVKPIAEMNLAGNLLDLLQNIEEVGNDPYPYGSVRSPAIRFNELMVSGT